MYNLHFRVLISLCFMQIFDRLRNEKPDVIKNVKAIEANFEAHDLNISQANKDIIWDEVDVRDAVRFCTTKSSACDLILVFCFLVLVAKSHLHMA